ncbi:invasion associated locus B family protein [Loktanella sp. Alg231-35]|uniref:invasion associated locus B family protein n=1 Tax=Loktanella sp. Alg231-35 TaxID=1922220 RepID=UPI00131F44E4|nr:invasion associated locus B family protein [Loktanella sp. Alg231-35]
MTMPIPERTKTVKRASTLAAGLCAAATMGLSQEPSSLSETYGDWTLQCVTNDAPLDTGEVGRICQVSQELRQSDGGSRVITAVFKTDPVKITFFTPFGLLLTAGIDLSVGERKLPSSAFRTCLPEMGCVAEGFFNAEDLAEIRSSETLSVLMTAESGQKLQVDLSLEGFSDAVMKLESIQ